MIADYAEERGISEGYIIPSLEEKEMYVYEAVAVGRTVMEQRVAGRSMSEVELE